MICGDCEKKILKSDTYRCYDCLKYICETCAPAHFKDNPVPLVWKRAAPNRVGYWLRLNAHSQLEIYKVTNDKGLVIDWPLETVKIKTNKDLLSGFQWIGPFPKPPKGPIYIPKEK